MEHHENLSKIRHSLAHLLAAAVLEIYPKAKPTIGPAIDNGFYYDFDDLKISDSDLPTIESKMREVLKTWKGFEKIPETKDSAQTRYSENQYKNELVQELTTKGEDITSYKSGVFVDLCRGGHVENIKDLKPDAFKLSHVAGAYWRGSEKNPMLTRIYGLAFANKKELEEYVAQQEEAKKRDHKKLGQELDLFTFSELVGSGLPLWTPKGTLLRDLLDDFVWQLRKTRGYDRVDIPHITKKDLYEKSGHWDKFKDELYKIQTREGHLLAMKPMNCPHHTQIYARKQWSYRELPQRYASTTKVYRDEQSGELSGISRVISITQDDAHIFCRISQAKDEMQKVWDMVHEFYLAFGMKLHLQLSLRDPSKPEKYLGSKDKWEKAEEILKEIAQNNKTEYVEARGEAAFYAPKLDFIATDSMGREWQVATIQLDVYMPESFGLNCINENGEKEGIVMIHAAIMGSIERFLSVLIEHYGGAFPVWLSPVQVAVLPISDKQNDWAEKVCNELGSNGIRFDLKNDSEKLGKKIREAEMQKVPYILVVGEKEEKAKSVAVRKRSEGDVGVVGLDEFIEKILEEIKNKKTNPQTATNSLRVVR